MDECRDISLKSLFVCVLDKIWVIAITVIVFGAAAFLLTKFAITPQYRATIRLYVNNKTEATNSLTSSDVSAAKSLVETYTTIMKSDFVIDDIAKRARLVYNSEQIRRMMSAKAVNGTEVLDVSITGASPKDCAVIANLAAELAPEKISGIVDGSSVKIIDRAKIPVKPISPSMLKNIAIACLLGVVLSSVVIIIMYMFNALIYGEEDLKAFCSLPILGVFSNLDQINRDKYDNSYVGRGRKK